MSNDPRKKAAAKPADVGSLLNILAGNTKANSGKAYAAGNCKLSARNHKYTSGKAMTVVNSHEAINRWMPTPILAAADNASHCLSAVVTVYSDCWAASKKTTITGGIAAIWGCPASQTIPTQTKTRLIKPSICQRLAEASVTREIDRGRWIQAPIIRQIVQKKMATIKVQCVALMIIGSKPVAKAGAKFDFNPFNNNSISNRPTSTLRAYDQGSWLTKKPIIAVPDGTKNNFRTCLESFQEYSQEG